MMDSEMGQDILSFVDGDPEYYTAIEAFVGNLPDRVEDIQTAFDSQALNELAAKLSSATRPDTTSSDQTCRHLQDITESAEDIDEIFSQMDSMIQLCLVTQFETDCPKPDSEY